MDVVGNGQQQKCLKCNEIFESKKKLKKHKYKIHSI